ncbi:MAG: TlyA family RNA methyltransferase [bacterium]|nr:TlyA family RNA methyltransferase [bacterium]
MKIRLDQLLVERGLFPSRTRAQAAIMAGKVIVEGQSNPKAGDRVDPKVKIKLIEPDHPYVSRGGLKLEGALKHFGIDPAGWDILDIGASTGGFTDCLLKRGAKHVTALDVGKGLIDWSLRTDNRVTVVENTNARHLEPSQLPGPYDLIVIDVSFISLKLIFPNLTARLKPGGCVLSLIKPQFEAGKGKAPKGIIRDPATWREVLTGFVPPDIFKAENPPGLVGFTVSPIQGKDGNREFFGLWRMGYEGIEQNKAIADIENLITGHL